MPLSGLVTHGIHKQVGLAEAEKGECSWCRFIPGVLDWDEEMHL